MFNLLLHLHQLLQYAHSVLQDLLVSVEIARFWVGGWGEWALLVKAILPLKIVELYFRRFQYSLNTVLHTRKINNWLRAIVSFFWIHIPLGVFTPVDLVAIFVFRVLFSLFDRFFSLSLLCLQKLLYILITWHLCLQHINKDQLRLGCKFLGRSEQDFLKRFALIFDYVQILALYDLQEVHKSVQDHFTYVYETLDYQELGLYVGSLLCFIVKTHLLFVQDAFVSLHLLQDVKWHLLAKFFQTTAVFLSTVVTILRKSYLSLHFCVFGESCLFFLYVVRLRYCHRALFLFRFGHLNIRTFGEMLVRSGDLRPSAYWLWLGLFDDIHICVFVVTFTCLRPRAQKLYIVLIMASQYLPLISGYRSMFFGLMCVWNMAWLVL